MTGDGSARPLSPPVPPDPRERPVVGEGLHRVGQCRQGGAPVPGPRPAAPAGRPRLLRPAGGGGQGGPGRPGPWPRGDRLLLLALLVRRAATPSTAIRRGAVLGCPRLPLLRRLGEPDLVGDLARGARPGPDRTDLPGPRRRHRALRGPQGRLRGPPLHQDRRPTVDVRLSARAPPRGGTIRRPLAEDGP